jgi:hypothetical protein
MSERHLETVLRHQPTGDVIETRDGDQFAEVDRLREALRRIAEKCEDDPRNQEPLEVAKFARLSLGDTPDE